MVKRLFIFLLVLVALSSKEANAVDKWHILFNGKVVYKGMQNMENSICKLRSRSFTTADSLSINYFSEDADKDWNRNFYITDSSGQTIATVSMPQQGGSAAFNSALINNMSAAKQPVFVYTTSLPKDPAKAATVRVRRILLCKIEWN